MIKKLRAFAGLIMTTDGKGPWDSSPAGDGNGGNKGGRSGGPKPDDTSDAPKGPRNPWDPIPINSGGQKKRGPSLEDLLRRTGGGGGGGGWGGLPKRADGKPIWPMVAGAFVLLWLVWTSVHRLGPEQEGVVTFFGKYSRTVGAGISFTAPAPFERIEKVDVTQIRTTSVGSPKADSKNLILTSDQNLIDMAYDVRWSIKSPELYLFQLDQPDETVKEVAESAMRAAVANFNLIQAIGPGRSGIEAEVRKRMQQVLDEYRSGVLVQSISIRQSDPPAEVNVAFREVNAAQQRRESYLSDARGYASRVTQLAQGETAEFDKIYEQYRQAPEVTKRRLYYETMEQVLGKVDKTIVETGGVTPYLPLPEFKKRAEPKPEDVVVSGKKP
jgi:modulator of FtsH protease HflK